MQEFYVCLTVSYVLIPGNSGITLYMYMRVNTLYNLFFTYFDFILTIAIVATVIAAAVVVATAVAAAVAILFLVVAVVAAAAAFAPTAA